jgi:hypothetical protein
MRLLTAATLVLIGCGTATAVVDTETDDGVEISEGALATDRADRACSVVLRSLGRVPSGPGFQTRCTTTSGCQVVWTGVLDVAESAIATGARPQVMFKNQDAAVWTVVTPRKTTGAPAGFVRYAVKLEKNTMSDGLSATALSRARIDVAPFLKLTDGSRLFDKQRGQSDFENYVLSQRTGWAVRDDASVCGPVRAPARLDFLASFTHEQTGAIVAGQTTSISYSLERLPTCRGTHNGHPAWDVTAFVRLVPSGDVVSGSVKSVQLVGGNPSSVNVVATPFTFDVPKGTTGLELWFKNFTGAGSTCESYDSNYGANYRFQVEAAPFADVQWVGRPGSSTSRLCSRQEGAPLELVLDSYLQQRACAFVEADVYVPGLTDGVGGLKPFAVLARATLRLDGTALEPMPLRFLGRFGNDYRFQFEIPKSPLFYQPTKWSRLDYTLEFSTDGQTWTKDVTRSVVRDETFCNPAWTSCAR